MQASPFITKGRKKESESQPLTLYHIKKTLLDKGKRCADCFRINGPVRLCRVRQKKGPLAEDGYCLLCHKCIIKRQEKRKEAKKRLWRRKVSKRKITKGGFLNRIRKKVFERDGYKCVWCNTKEGIGLGSLIPESRGGKLEFDNFVTTCWHCRPAKGSLLPLEYLWKDIDLDEFLKEQLDHALRVKGPGKNTTVRFGLLAEISEFLHKVTNSKTISDKVRTKAERINIKLLAS